jgi:hypothetical protein
MLLIERPLCDVILHDDLPENMLIGFTNDKLSPEGEKWVKERIPNK